MKRKALEGGGWFDCDSSKEFSESTHWNGNNHISDVTGSQWNHEELSRTRKGRWVLHSWSQWQGSEETWVEISGDEAAKWLLACRHGEVAQKYFPKVVDELEV